ncbi:MAG: hypothetical protein KDD53_07405 [Bdellovibrionales bacterium]|nr:hypothetical protein [Bdellovibrionales bacterium]
MASNTKVTNIRRDARDKKLQKKRRARIRKDIEKKTEKFAELLSLS